VKDTGGILEHGLRSLNIVCVPTAIPDAITIDVSQLAIGNAIHVSDIAGNYPEIEFLDDLGSMLAIVVPPAAEVKPAEEVAEAPTEPELISKEKKEEEGEKGEDTGKE
jgi:large subunit ribosomal protein L25